MQTGTALSVQQFLTENNVAVVPPCPRLSDLQRLPFAKDENLVKELKISGYPRV
jgi:hypothetical protein